MTSNGEEDNNNNMVRITLRTIGPSPPSSLDLHSPIKLSLSVGSDEKKESGGSGSGSSNDVFKLLSGSFNCSFCMQLPERPVTVRDLRKLISGNGRMPLENLRLVLQGNVLHDTKYGDDVSVHFNNGDTLIVAVKPKPPAKHIQNGLDDEEEELKFEVPELNSRWKKRFYITLHDKLKIPDMFLIALFSLSLKAWAVIIMWFIFAPIAHKWDVGPLYILGTGFLIIFMNLGKREQGDMSAYSIFNEDFRELPGTFNAERVDRDIRAGQF